MLAIALALLSSTSWGVADFLGGLKSRSVPLLVVMGVSQIAALIAIGAVIGIRGASPPDAGFIPFAIAGGVAVTVGLGAFYRGLAVGTMSVVAPISAVGSAIPVMFGFLLGERPSLVQIVGMALAIIGVMLAAREPPRPGETGRPLAAGVTFALIAAIGFGSFLTAMHQASVDDPFWATLVQRITSIAILGALIILRRPSFQKTRPHLVGLVAIGVLDVSASVLYSVASTLGMVSLIAVLASLYPVVTVLLAHVILHERLAPSQRVGAAAAFGGVGLISFA